MPVFWLNLKQKGVGSMIDVASNVLEQLKKTARPIARAEQEASVQEIILALEDAGAEPAIGSSETTEDIAWSLYY